MELVNRSVYPDICHRILDELDKKLPGHLTYHCLDHTIDVANVCDHYISYYSVDDRISELIRVAAVAHDFGYIYGPEDHEERSILEVGPLLRKGYLKKEIDLIEGMIRATKVPQDPSNLYEEILADADLDYLGRDDYNSLSDGLYKEFLYFGIVGSEAEWIKLQIRFLENHNYHTDWANRNRVANKRKVLEKLRKKASSGL